MAHRALLLVEASPHEATLARTALELSAEGYEVIEAADLESADEVIRRAEPEVALVILGKSALHGLNGPLVVPAVGVGANLTEADRARAARAGVATVHERPREWRAYCTLMRRLLAERLPPTRTD